MKFIYRLLRILLAALFVGAALLKLFAYSTYVEDVRNFDILPGEFIYPFALSYIVAEILGGIGLVFERFMRLSSLLLISLVGASTVAIVMNVARGNFVRCGCFGSVLSEPIGSTAVIRNLFLLVGLLAVQSVKNQWTSHGSKP